MDACACAVVHNSWECLRGFYDMDRFRRLSWACLWSCFLSGIFSIGVAEAATRKSVTLPSSQSVATGNGATSRSGDLLGKEGAALEGEYIPGATLDKSLPVKIIPRIDFSIPTTINAAKNLLKGGVQGMVLSAALQGMLDSVGAVIDDGGKVVKVSTATAQPVSSSDYVWKVSNVTNSFTTPTEACDYFRTTRTSYVSSEARFVSDAQFACWGTTLSGASIHYTDASRYGTTCPIDSVWDSASGSCQTNQGFMELSSSDWDSMGQFANGQPADWLGGLLKDVCSSGPNPPSCFESLKASSALSGPAEVSAPTTTSTQTYTKPDGTTGTKVTTTNTKYAIKYGDNYYDYSKTSIVNVSQDGQPVSSETTTESPDVTEEKPPEDSSPCTTNCDGPAYKDQYDPTTDTKESLLDSYKGRISSIPIIQAVPAFFAVSVSSSCPVWSYNGSLGVLGFSMPLNLTFDFHCRDWFTSYQTYAMAAVALVCAFFAFRVAVLD